MTEEEDWEVPLVDYYIMETPDGDFPTRQANGLAVNVITCRDDDKRGVVAMLLYSTELQMGLLMPLSPETVANVAMALTALVPPTDKGTAQ